MELTRKRGAKAVARYHTPPRPSLRFDTIAPGRSHMCALQPGGAARCWGSDQYKQRGDGADHRPRGAPVAVADGRSSSTIATGDNQTCALDTAGAAWCWGTDFSGQIGDGFGGPQPKLRPVAVVGVRT